ncbi:segregation/condensation protein A, partial [Acidaminococcus intestini]
KKQKLAFTDFIHARHNRSETIAAFLALLELLRLKQISIQQDGAFSPIYITERKETAHGDIETGTA